MSIAGVKAKTFKKVNTDIIDGDYTFTVTIGSKLPISKINYSSQEQQVTVTGKDFDSVHRLCREKYEEVESAHLEYFNG